MFTVEQRDALRDRLLRLAVVHTYITTQVADAARFWAELSADPTRLATEVQVARARRQVRAG